jgi:hypothetical protein
MSATDRVVTVNGTAALARQGVWPKSVRTEVGVLAGGQKVSVYLGTVIVDMRENHHHSK